MRRIPQADNSNPLPFGASEWNANWEAARFLNVSVTTVRNLAIGNKVRSTRVGDRTRFRRAWLDEWIDAGGGEIPAPPPSPPRLIAEPRKPLLAARPVRRRAEPKPKPPTFIQRVGDQEMRLLSDTGGDRYGRVHTWHIGVRTPLCEASGRWDSRLVRQPRANLCPKCLTSLAAHPEADLKRFDVSRVFMMRITRRGETATTIRSGYHAGDGRRTLCGKKDGAWALTEREPRMKQCFECEHRIRWDARDLDRNVFAPRPMTPLRVLVDVGVLDTRLAKLVERHPHSLDARQALQPLVDRVTWYRDMWDAEHRRATAIGEFIWPTSGPLSKLERWSSYTISGNPEVGVEVTEEVLQKLEETAVTIERATVLYTRWAKDPPKQSRA